MWLRDDDVYEGVERLNLVLELSPQDPRVQIVPNRKKATIYIHDSQDGKYICSVVSVLPELACTYCRPFSWLVKTA